jgi:hypothetical protein
VARRLLRRQAVQVEVGPRINPIKHCRIKRKPRT